MRLFLNLASRDYFSQRRTTLTLQLVGAVLLVMLLLQAGLLVQNLQLTATYQTQVAELDQQLKGEANPERLAPETLQQWEKAYDYAAQLLRKDAYRWTELLDRMEKLLPEGVSLRGFRPDYEQNSLALSGVARDLERLQRLLSNLQGDSFRKVYLTSQSRVLLRDPQGQERQALAFTIALEGSLD